MTARDHALDAPGAARQGATVSGRGALVGLLLAAHEAGSAGEATEARETIETRKAGVVAESDATAEDVSSGTTARAEADEADDSDERNERNERNEVGGVDADDADDDGVEDALALVRGHGTGQGRSSGSRHLAVTWHEARSRAARAGRRARLGARQVPLAQALGQVLAEPLTALSDLPSFDTSAMDGWAVSGPGPWKTGSLDTDARAGEEPGILAGHGGPGALGDGRAVRIATGARVPDGATAVIRSEHARTDTGGNLHARSQVTHGQDIRPRGQECRSGDELLPEGVTVTPAVLGLAAAAGYDRLLTVRPPRVQVLVLGDELLSEGLPHDGLIRDALGPMIGPWLRALGAETLGTLRVRDDADALYQAVMASEADLLVTTGGTAGGPVDHVHPVLRRARAELLVDGVAVRPGHPMLLARLAAGRYLVGLPGNPLAAVSGLVTLAEPLLREMSGQEVSLGGATPGRSFATLGAEAQGHPEDTRLAPVVRRGGRLVPLRYNGPAMLRGIAAAHGLAVVPPGGAKAGDELELLEIPWSPVYAPSTPSTTTTQSTTTTPPPTEGRFT
ncbi:molybdopterin molybdotransferase MoeA [Streptomyces sp. NPDC059828]|uniref:molybdopterin molybdotransferase MoeA n=1 Tax=Streptomyces sp. NPDC059828 TaxID=3346965 RepID=UPI003659A5D0